jgi:hypothetical protein
LGVGVKCAHKNTVISEPHLAGARRCLDCNAYYNPNMGGWLKEVKKLRIRNPFYFKKSIVRL